MSSPYNRNAGNEITSYTTGPETQVIISYDFAYNDDSENYENCVMAIDAEILGSVNGEEAYFKRFNVLAARTTFDVGFINAPAVTLGPISTMNLSTATVNLIATGTQIQLVATGVEGYAITWRGVLKIRIN